NTASEGLEGAALCGRSRPVAQGAALRPRHARAGEDDDTCHSSEDPISKIGNRKSKIVKRSARPRRFRVSNFVFRVSNFEFRVSIFDFLGEKHGATRISSYFGFIKYRR